MPRIVRRVLSPDLEIFGQGVRFVIAGGTVAVVYLTVTTVLSWGLGVRFQLALGIGFATGVLLHFTLQRVFVWKHAAGFALSYRAQIARYVLVAAAQYGATALVTAFVSEQLGVSPTAVYLVWMFVVTGLSFGIFRRGVFHPGESGPPTSASSAQ